MLALMKGADATELLLPSGTFIQVPEDVACVSGGTAEIDVALRWSFKAGLINHAEFLAARDVLVVEKKSPIHVAL